MSRAQADPGRLKVLRVIARLNIGGPARHVDVLARGLCARGYDTTVAYGEPAIGEGSFEALLTPEHGARIKIAGLGRQIRAFDDFRAFVTLLRLIFRQQPDVVHTHTAKAGVLGRIAGALYNATRRRSGRAAIVHTYHGTVFEGYFSRPVNLMIRMVERTLARVSDAIVAIAPQQRDDLVRRYRVAPAAKVATIRLGLDLEPLLAITAGSGTLRSDLGLGAEVPVIGFVGRLVPIKNVDLLIRAFARLREVAGGPVLVIAGDGPLSGELGRLAAQLGVGHRVRFVGWVHDLPRLYRTCDLVVLSSRNEGTPVTLIEAMAAGRAVVATRVGGVPDVVSDGENGLLVSSGDETGLAEAMARLLAHPGERSRMGELARRRVADTYSRERLVDETDRLYRSVLSSRRFVG